MQSPDPGARLPQRRNDAAHLHGAMLRLDDVQHLYAHLTGGGRPEPQRDSTVRCDGGPKRSGMHGVRVDRIEQAGELHSCCTAVGRGDLELEAREIARLINVYRGGPRPVPDGREVAGHLAVAVW